jgi:hypothetical protein
MNINKILGILTLWLIQSSMLVAASSSPHPQVDELRAFFRSGQTFLTWRQVDGKGYHYRIYRSEKLFRAADDLTAGRRVAEVHDHTSLNFSASVDLNEINTQSRNNPSFEYEIKQPVYYVIEDQGAPLAKTTGLFVYTAKDEAAAFYAVTAVKEGVESKELGPGNTLAQAVAERVEFPAAVRQGGEDFVHWTDSVGTPFYPAMGSVPSVPYNFRVKAPARKGPHALILVLHGAGMQYKKSGLGTPKAEQTVRIMLDSPRFSGRIKDLPEIEYPSSQGWLGYNENFGTGKPLEEGKIVPYTQRRVLWMIDWAERQYAIDSDRVSMHGSSMGSVGVLTIGLMFPERFALIHARIPILGRLERRGDGKTERPSDSGFGFSTAEYIEQHPEKEFPYIEYTAGRLDNTVGWPNKITFAREMESLKRGFAFFWDLRAHVGAFVGTPPEGLKGPPIYWDSKGGGDTMPMSDFSRKQSYPALANLSVNDDPGTVDFAVRGKPRPPWNTPGAGDLIGTINGAVTWDRATIVDQPQRYEITLRLLPNTKSDRATADVTPRRLQQFHPEPAKAYVYTVAEEGASTELASGRITADAHGVVTAIKVPITKRGTQLVLRPDAQ